MDEFSRSRRGKGTSIERSRRDKRIADAVAPAAVSGDVFGPGVAVNNDIAVFDGTTGKRIKDSGVLIATLKTRAITFVIDGGGSVLTTGVKGDISVPFACTITGARLLADLSGSVVVNIWKDTYANYPPVVGDKITASAPPTISTALKSDDVVLTGWTTSIVAGDTLRFNIDSVTTITRVTLTLTVTT